MAASWGGAEAEVAAQRYAARLVDAHAEGCMWRAVSPPPREAAAGRRRRDARGAAEWWAMAAEMALFPAPSAAVRRPPPDGAADEPRAVPLPSLLEDFRARYRALSRVERLPRVGDACVGRMDRLMTAGGAAPEGPGLVSRLVRREDARVRRAMAAIVGGGVAAAPAGDELGYSRSRVLLAACGWSPRLMPFTVSAGEGTQSVVSPGGAGEKGARWPASSVVLECASCGARVPLWMTALGRDSRLAGLETPLSSPPAVAPAGTGEEAPPAKRLRVEPPRSPGGIDLLGSIAGGPSPIGTPKGGGGSPAPIAMPFGRGAAARTPVMRPRAEGDPPPSAPASPGKGVDGPQDILALHRPYCRWVCSPADVFPGEDAALLRRFEGRKCGWQLVVSALMGNEMGDE